MSRLQDRLRKLAKEMTEGDPVTAAMLILSAKEIDRLNGIWEKAGDRCPQCGTGIARPEGEAIELLRDCVPFVAGVAHSRAFDLERRIVAFLNQSPPQSQQEK